MNDPNKIDYIIIGKLQKSAGKMSFSKRKTKNPYLDCQIEINFDG